MLYHHQFRSKKNIEVSLDWLETDSKYNKIDTKSIRNAGKRLVESRKELCKS